MLPQPPDEEIVFLEPHNREAEEAVIGCVLIAPELFDELSGILRSSDFYIHRLGFIWTSFERLIKDGKDIDSLTVCQELDDMGRLEDVGGPAFLTILLNQVPTTLHAESYAEVVKNYAGKREFLRMANTIARYSTNGKNVAEIAAFTEREVGRISIANNIETNSILSSKEAVKLGANATENMAQGKAKIVPTGFIDLDNLLRGGLREGRLMLIAGRPGDGKSSLLMSIAHNAALIHKKRVGIFSMEMPTEEQVNRLIAQISGIDYNRVESGQFMDDDWPIYYDALERVGDLNIYWDDTPSLTIPQLRTKARKMAEMGLDIILLDSLNLLNAQMPGLKPYEKINEMGYQLKILARELSIPLIAAHHMSRSIEQTEREPILSDLEQAGEKPADIVGFIYQSKDDPTMSNVRYLKIAKHRGGPLGKISLIFRSNLTKFENATCRIVSLIDRKDIDE